MNKNRVNRDLPIAYQALKAVEIAKGTVIKKTYRGQISTFGTAVSMGSMPAAIAFFSEKAAGADNGVDRTLLLRAIEYVLRHRETPVLDENTCLFDYAVNGGISAKEEILTAAIALKLAMNLYELEETKK